MKRLILGIDPGIKIGLAVLDLRGKLMFLGVSKGGREQIVKEISAYGRPIIIATDVNPVPHFVKRLASVWNSRLWKPNKVFKTTEKERVTHGIKNDHERDAYAAALKAYRLYANRFRSIEALGLTIEVEEELKEAVVRGKAFKKILKKIKSTPQP